MSTKHPTGNDDRSQKKNPEHSQYEADQLNQQKQKQQQQGDGDGQKPPPSTPKK
jgi:hypothetical protein